MFIAYAFFSLLMTVYSYVLVDLNFTLFNSPWWESFRSYVIQIGYYQRNLSAIIYSFFVLIFFGLYFWAIKREKKINVMHLALLIGSIFLFSYPLLSHDFFNYLFDAKIVTFYHQNPYLHAALNFPNDPWLRFMHWTHRTYPYGPVFLLITLVPSFLSFGKLLFSFFLFKATWIIFYLFAVYFLEKLNRRWALIFATHPLVLIEGLINSHNDFIGISLIFIGYCLLVNQKKLWGRVVLVLSAGIKYMTTPFILISQRKKSAINLLALGLTLLILIYFSFFQEIQPWYFLVLLGFIPLYEKLVQRLWIFFAGLLFSYYPYLANGEWSQSQNITLKHTIISTFFIACLLYNVLFHDWIYKKIFSKA